MLEEVFTASDETALRSDLGKLGYHPLRRQAAGAPKLAMPGLGKSGRRRINVQEFVIFNQELAALLKGGPAAAPDPGSDAGADAQPVLQGRAHRRPGPGQERRGPLRGLRRPRRPVPAPLSVVAQGRREERRAGAGDPPLHPLHEAGARRPAAGGLGADLSGGPGLPVDRHDRHHGDLRGAEVHELLHRARHRPAVPHPGGAVDLHLRQSELAGHPPRAGGGQSWRCARGATPSRGG